MNWVVLLQMLALFGGSGVVLAWLQWSTKYHQKNHREEWKP
jgi:hypothetical protein